MLGIYKTIAVFLGTLSSLHAARTGPDKSNGSKFKFCGSDETPSSFLSSRDSMYMEFISDSSDNAQGFKVMIIEVEQCGGRLTATSVKRNLSSPGYPYAYFNNLNCTWIITAENETDTVGLKMVHSDIERPTPPSAICRYDVLRVYNGNTTKDDQYLGESCSNQAPSYQSSKNSLSVRFTTDDVTNKNGFRMQYFARKVGDCNNTFLVYFSPLIILSPGYPDSYESNLECFIKVTDASSTLTHDIKLDIVDSDLEGAYPHCDKDSVTLHQGFYRGGNESTFCGDSSITSFGPYYFGLYMIMVFKTNGDTSGRGFRIRASLSLQKPEPPQSGDCGSLFLNATTNRQLLQSPGYPVRYKNNEDCRWTITASNHGMMVRIDVTDSDVGSYDDGYYDCTYGYVTAYDGPSTFSDIISSWCGPSRPTLQSTGPAMTIHFHTDSTSLKRGFKLAYFETNEPYNCGGTLTISTTDNTTLTSPFYPGPYPNRQDCKWIIHAPAHTTIEAQIRDSIVEGVLPCPNDYLEVYDGVMSSSSSAGKYCGHDDTDYISSGPIITVRFHSDSSTRYKGFQMHLKAGHFRASGTKEISDSYGSIYSPNYPFSYPSNAEVSWKITVSEDFKVEINVKESRLERSNGCIRDYVEAFDGPDSNAPSLGRLCGKNTYIQESSGPVMFLKFKSDSSGVDDGFEMTYSREINHKSSGSNIGVIIGGSIGGAFFLLLVIIVICINTKKRRAATAVPVQVQVVQVPLVNNSGQAPITNALPPTTFTGPPTDTTQGLPLPSSGYVNAEALPKKI
ncbi:deleted in malignant brain tumors 1 protein-like isoform X2 [Haliotis rubra]|uniref:deleted in malignant brain tumors 1 protein-like isoform X2 n=1 Tax=Haliotis rubra TaxID=36100 RepID=UPI001EE5C993|nr:deleted in malignant brain tumors 1 protein-like isoform X2 [Haliotis rubra]